MGATYQRTRNGKVQTVFRADNHGQSGTKLYYKWKAMIRRCESEVADNYQWYGGKGVTVCPEWRSDFMVFKAWADSTGYAPGLELDRKDSDGPYSPDNCQWRTKKANIRNRDLFWSDELDQTLVEFAASRGMSPYDVIECAVVEFLAQHNVGR